MHNLLSITQSPHSQSTINLGNTISSILKAEITLFTVCKNSDDNNDVYTELNKTANSLYKSPTIKIANGNPEIEILKELKSNRYQLLTIGERSHVTHPSEVLLGDTTNRIVKNSPISVLIAKGNNHSIRNILVCTSGPQCNLEAINASIHMCQHSQATLTLLHVGNPIPSMYTGLTQIGETLADLLKTDTPTAMHLRNCANLLDEAQIKGEIELRHGTPTEEILRDIEQNNYDLLVIGASQSNTINKFLLDDVSIKLANHSPISTLIVKNFIDN